MSSENDISDMINEIVNSSDYIPTMADLDWTRQAIQTIKAWMVPSAGCIFYINRENMFFDAAINGSPTTQQLLAYAKVRMNLIVLGFRENNKFVIPNTSSVEEIYFHSHEGTLEGLQHAIQRGRDTADQLNPEWEEKSNID